MGSSLALLDEYYTKNPTPCAAISVQNSKTYSTSLTLKKLADNW